MEQHEYALTTPTTTTMTSMVRERRCRRHYDGGGADRGGVTRTDGVRGRKEIDGGGVREG